MTIMIMLHIQICPDIHSHCVVHRYTKCSDYKREAWTEPLFGLLKSICSSSNLVLSPVTETQVSAIFSTLPFETSAMVNARDVPSDSAVKDGGLTRGTMAPFKYMVLLFPTTIILRRPLPEASCLCMWPKMTNGTEYGAASFNWAKACARSAQNKQSRANEKKMFHWSWEDLVNQDLSTLLSSGAMV